MGEPATKLSPAERYGHRHPAVRFRTVREAPPDLSQGCLVEHFRTHLHLRNGRLRHFLAGLCLLSQKHGCAYQYQRTYAKKHGVTDRTIRAWLATLRELGLVLVELTGPYEAHVFPNWEALGLREVTEESSGLPSGVPSDLSSGLSFKRIEGSDGSDRTRAEATRTHAETGEASPPAAAASVARASDPEKSPSGCGAAHSTGDTQPCDDAATYAPPEALERTVPTRETSELPRAPSRGVLDEEVSPIAVGQWPSEERMRELELDRPAPSRPADGPRKSTPPLAPDVLVRLQCLPGWQDAEPFLRRARLTADEQRRVLDKLERMKPKNAGKACHGPIQDVLNERDREAETVEQLPPLGDVSGMGDEEARQLLRSITDQHQRIVHQDPVKARALRLQIGELRARLGIRAVNPSPPPPPISDAKARERDTRGHLPSNARILEILSSHLKESPHV